MLPMQDPADVWPEGVKVNRLSTRVPGLGKPDGRIDLDSEAMKPSASTVYLTSSSLTVAVLTLTNERSACTRLATRTSTCGSNTTSPFIHSTPCLPVALRARSRLFEVLVWSYCSL